MRLGDLCYIEKGQIGIKKAISGDYPMVTTAETRITHNSYQFDANAVIIPLVSSTGHGHASINRLHYQEGKFALGSILCALVPKNAKLLSARWLYHYLSFQKDEILVPLMKGAANVSLSVGRIADIEINFPSFDKQLKDLELIEALKIKQGDFLNQFDLQKKNLNSLRSAILREAIQGKLVPQDLSEGNAQDLLNQIKKEREELVGGKRLRKSDIKTIDPGEIPFEIPENWVWCRLGDVFLTSSGGTPQRGNPIYWNNGTIPWLKSGELTDDYIINLPEEFITQAGVNNSSAKIFRKGTLLIALYGATAGKLGILNFDSTTNQAICAFFENNNIHIRYLFYYLWNFRKKIISDSWGQAQPNISQEYLKNFLFALPPYSEQLRIVQKLDQVMKNTNILEGGISESKYLSERLLKVGLKEVFNS